MHPFFERDFVEITAHYCNWYFIVFQVSVAELELRQMAEERDKLLNDANYNSLQNDEAVSRARQERDEAIERKKAVEVRFHILHFMRLDITQWRKISDPVLRRT